ncbi:hypothetical protein GCM10023149_21440 [Mucilaginibacter gynuensis]|uniref:Uncharacterized protein n=1 Tax=Mucilaginibacter gynuensis TaxID=1302236 RepID=A0ABP8GC48_9SPHI
MENTDALKNRNAELIAENEQLKEDARQLAEVTQAYQESQNRFQAVFEASRLGNKIIASDLKILILTAQLFL